MSSTLNPKKMYPTSYRNPKCSRCRNHGFDIKMKGHKGFCPYLLCNCLKCILVEERRRISRQQILLQRHPDINVKDIFKGCLRCEKSCQQLQDYSNCVSTESYLPSAPPYPLMPGNQGLPTVNLPLNLQMSTPPPPTFLYPATTTGHPQSAAAADYGYYPTPTTSTSHHARGGGGVGLAGFSPCLPSPSSPPPSSKMAAAADQPSSSSSISSSSGGSDGIGGGGGGGSNNTTTNNNNTTTTTTNNINNSGSSSGSGGSSGSGPYPAAMFYPGLPTTATTTVTAASGPDFGHHTPAPPPPPPQYIYQANAYQWTRASPNLAFPTSSSSSTSASSSSCSYSPATHAYGRAPPPPPPPAAALFWNYPLSGPAVTSWSQRFCEDFAAVAAAATATGASVGAALPPHQPPPDVKTLLIPENLSFKAPDSEMESSCKISADTTK